MFVVRQFGLDAGRHVSDQDVFVSKDEALSFIRDIIKDRQTVRSSDEALEVVDENTLLRIVLMQTEDNIVPDMDTISYYYSYNDDFSVEVMANAKTNEYVVFCLDKTLPHMKFCIGTLPMNGRKPEEAYYMFLDEIQAVVDMKD